MAERAAARTRSGGPRHPARARTCRCPTSSPMSVSTRRTRWPTWPPALNTVQRTRPRPRRRAGRAAAEPSRRFVNLGRRNQNLLDRQLDFISDLEQRRAGPRAPSRTCSSSTTSPPACAATPSRCWGWPAATRPARGPRRCGSARYPGRDGRDQGLPAGRRPRASRPPSSGTAAADLSHAGRAGGERAGLLAARPERRHPGPLHGTAWAAALLAGDHRTGLGMPDDGSAPPTGAWPVTEGSPSPRPGTWATTSPVTWPVAIASCVHLSHSPGNGVTATITLPPDLLTTEPVTSNTITPPHGQRAVRL